MRKLGRWRLLAITALLILVPVQVAWAHAQLLGTMPAGNAVLEAAPEAVSLQFNEPVTPLAIKLVQPDGRQIDLIDATTGGTTVSVQLPSADTGTQVLSWRVVSTDGHPISGSLVFSIGRVTGSTPPDASSDGAVSVALWLGKTALFIALFVGVGGAVFLAVAEPPSRGRRAATYLSVAGILIAPATLGLQGLDALGLSTSSVFDADVWGTGLSTSYGATAIAVAVAFALSLAALLLPPGRTVSSIGLLAGALAALSLALSGHASAADPQWLTRPAVFLHIAGLLFWIGALLPLWLLLRDGSAAADLALTRFSQVIPFAVAALVISGVTLASIQMGAPGPQWFSPYGAILAGKLALLLVVFALALWNRIKLTSPALAGDVRAQHRLRRSIGLEAVIILVILGLVAGWRFTPPPRALATAPVQAAVEPILVHLMDETTMAMVTVSPGSTGPVSLEIQLIDMEGAQIDAQTIGVVLSSPTLGIEPFKANALETPSGWIVEGVTIPVAGVWLLDLDIRLSRFELTKLQTEVEIP